MILFALSLLAQAPTTLSMSKGAALVSCTVVDGDSLHCRAPGRQGYEKIRLIGIDAPEMRGHCRPGRTCAQGDPEASKQALARLVEGRPVRLERQGTDIYGRTLAFAWVNGVSLSCAQVRGGHADYVPRWDRDGRVGRCR